MVRTRTAPRSLWWRWSMRDLRQHLVAVVTIGVVIAIGIGVYAGLGSSSVWRRTSNDASFGQVRMHDLRVALGPGTFVATGELLELVGRAEHAGSIDAATERLVVDSQIDASTPDEAILVTARLIGTALDDADAVDQVWLASGTRPPDDPADPSLLLESKFAEYYDLPVTGRVTIAGGAEVGYTGFGTAPEEFSVTGQQGAIMAEADLANLYTHLDVAQALAGREAAVNDLVITVAPGADRDLLQREIEALLDDPASGIGATVTTREEADAYRLLYEDIDNDQKIWNALSALVLLAAALAAFNLISRIVEAQRREIGIGMALGLRRRQLAIRPVLIGLQVGLVGALLGIGVGMLLAEAMRRMLEDMLPLPQYLTPFQTGIYLRGVLLGVVPPLVASVIPVWRAVRVQPIEAIRTGHLAASTGRLANWSGRIRVPGSSMSQMPLRNLLRSPRRTLLTAVGVGAAITALVATLGMLDSFFATVDVGVAEITQDEPDRVTVSLDTFHPTDSAEVQMIVSRPEVGAADTTLRLPATLPNAGGEDIDVVIELLDLDEAIWSPTVLDESPGGADSGLLLAEKAAADLGVRPGDRVSFRHLRLDDGRWSFTTSELTVAGLHPNPVRNFVYLDERHADLFGMAGTTNGLQTTPAGGYTTGDLQKAVFSLPGVTSAQPIGRVGEMFDEALEQFVGFLYMTAAAVLLLALLIALNSTRISVDERRREHATMLAFGIPPRSVLWLVVRESIVVGCLATALGLFGGYLGMQWMLGSITSNSLPDIGVIASISWTTYLAAFTVGIVAVSLAPVFLVRRIERMNLPDTLRVME
jgi:putative ABC transport system permease protein